MGQKQKVMIQVASENGDWINVKDSLNREIGVMKSKNPKLAEAIGMAIDMQALPTEIEMEVSERGGKIYGWDVKAEGTGSGFKGGQKKDTEVITFLSCLSTAASQVAGSSDNKNREWVLETAEMYYKAAMAKKPQQA